MKQKIIAILIFSFLLISNINTSNCSSILNDEIDQLTKKHVLSNVAWFLYHEIEFEEDMPLQVIKFIKKKRKDTRTTRNKMRHNLKIFAKHPHKKLYLDTWISKNLSLFNIQAPDTKSNLNDWLAYWSPQINEIRKQVRNIASSN